MRFVIRNTVTLTSKTAIDRRLSSTEQLFTGTSGSGGPPPSAKPVAEGDADLGMEAIYEFEVEDMPVTVAVDSQGEAVHKTGPTFWQQEIKKRA